MSYTPIPPIKGTDPADYTFGELMDLARALQEAQPFLFLQTRHAEPDRPREGMIAKADGTDWNPGSGGAGMYGYIGGAWVKLG